MVSIRLLMDACVEWDSEPLKQASGESRIDFINRSLASPTSRQEQTSKFEQSKPTSASEVNPYRQIPLRLFGYANELGEALKPFLKTPPLSYIYWGVVFIGRAPASVVFPGFCETGVFWGVGGAGGTKQVQTMAGLASIPFIIKPIDAGVEFMMDKTVRKLFK